MTFQQWVCVAYLARMGDMGGNCCRGSTSTCSSLVSAIASLIRPQSLLWPSSGRPSSLHLPSCSPSSVTEKGEVEGSALLDLALSQASVLWDNWLPKSTVLEVEVRPRETSCNA